MEIPLLLMQFLENKTQAGPMMLPFHYPDAAMLEGYQSGFRYHGITGEDLTAEAPGGWRPGWYVIALNGLGDPFFIDFREAQNGFPVYYAEHGAGYWEPVKVADGLAQFSEFLQKLRALARDEQAGLDYVFSRADEGNPFWSEVLAGMKAGSPVEQKSPLSPDQCRYGRLVLQAAGPDKVKVAQYLRRYFEYGPAEALALLAWSGETLAEGFYVHLEPYLTDLRELGAMASFEEQNLENPSS